MTDRPNPWRFFDRTLAWFRPQGIAVQAVATNNGSAYWPNMRRRIRPLQALQRGASRLRDIHGVGELGSLVECGRDRFGLC